MSKTALPTDNGHSQPLPNVGAFAQGSALAELDFDTPRLERYRAAETELGKLQNMVATDPLFTLIGAYLEATGYRHQRNREEQRPCDSIAGISSIQGKRAFPLFRESWLGVEYQLALLPSGELARRNVVRQPYGDERGFDRPVTVQDMEALLKDGHSAESMRQAALATVRKLVTGSESAGGQPPASELSEIDLIKRFGTVIIQNSQADRKLEERGATLYDRLRDLEKSDPQVIKLIATLKETGETLPVFHDTFMQSEWLTRNPILKGALGYSFVHTLIVTGDGIMKSQTLHSTGNGNLLGQMAADLVSDAAFDRIMDRRFEGPRRLTRRDAFDAVNQGGLDPERVIDRIREMAESHLMQSQVKG